MDIKDDLTNIKFLTFIPECSKSIEEIMFAFAQQTRTIDAEKIINISVSGDFDINSSGVYTGDATFIIFYKK